MDGPPTDNSDETKSGVPVSQSLRQACIEVGWFAAPVGVIALIGAFTWRPTVFWLAICGWAGLSLGIGRSRASEGLTIIRWPHPSSTLDKVTTAIAYNGVLGLGTLVSTIAWLATRWFIIGVVVATVMPVWLLKHIRIILELSEPE